MTLTEREMLIKNMKRKFKKIPLNKCPICKTKKLNMIVLKMEFIDPFILCTIKCNKCKSKFTEEFNSTGYILTYNGRLKI